MLEITESWVDSLAPNSAAIKNGHELVKKESLLHFIKPRTGKFCLGSVQAAERPLISLRPIL